MSDSSSSSGGGVGVTGLLGVAFIVLKLNPVGVSTSYYKVIFKPSEIIPDPELQ